MLRTELKESGEEFAYPITLIPTINVSMSLSNRSVMSNIVYRETYQ